jgi:hypothetical protein
MTAGGISVTSVGDSAVVGGIGEAVTVPGTLPVGIGFGVCDALTAAAGVECKLIPPTLTQISAVSIITADNKFVKTKILSKKRRYAAIIYLWGGVKFREKGMKKGDPTAGIHPISSIVLKNASRGVMHRRLCLWLC